MKKFHKTYGSHQKESIRSCQVIKDEDTFFHDACDAAKLNRVRVQPGKGDSPRNCFSVDYRNNYDAIEWTGDRKKLLSEHPAYHKAIHEVAKTYAIEGKAISKSS